MASVLITSHRAPLAVDIARDLVGNGHRVFAAESVPGLLTGSPLVTRSYRIPAARSHPEAHAAAVLGIVERHRIDHVLPVCEDLLWLAHAAESSPQLRSRLIASDAAVLDRLHSKSKFVALLAELGLPHPASELVTDHVRLAKIAPHDLAASRLVIKPDRGRFSARTEFVDHGSRARAVPTESAPWVVQGEVEGVEVCATIVASHGTLAGFVAYVPEWRSSGGSGGGVRSVPLPAADPRAVQLRELAATLVAATGVHGVIGLDVIFTADGPVPIECNPRPTGGLSLLGGDILAALNGDGTALVQRDTPAHVTLAGLSAALRHPRAFVRGRSVLAGVPLARQLRVFAAMGSLALRHRTSLVGATTVDLDWSGATPEPARTVEYPTSLAEGYGSRVVRAIGPHSIDNLSTPLTLMKMGGDTIPVSLPDPGGAYSVAPSTYYGAALVDETERLRPPWSTVFMPLATAIHGATRRGQLDRIVIAGNAAVSTNLHGHLRVDEARASAAALAANHPDCAIAWRSIATRDHDLVYALRAAGYVLIPARNVVFQQATAPELWRKVDVRRDLRILQASDYQVRKLTEPTRAEAERIAELYRALYLERYTDKSPHYSAEFVQRTAAEDLVRYTVLERDGRIDGVFGFMWRDGVVTVPVLGYEFSVPQSVGLYRMLTVLILQQARDMESIVNASSGVRSFKESRGGTACLEYLAVDVQHLPWRRQLPWRMLGPMLELVGVPAMRLLHM